MSNVSNVAVMMVGAAVILTAMGGCLIDQSQDKQLQSQQAQLAEAAVAIKNLQALSLVHDRELALAYERTGGDAMQSPEKPSR